jgi:hypothetical protein
MRAALSRPGHVGEPFFRSPNNGSAARSRSEARAGACAVHQCLSPAHTEASSMQSESEHSGFSRSKRSRLSCKTILRKRSRSIGSTGRCRMSGAAQRAKIEPFRTSCVRGFFNNRMNRSHRFFELDSPSTFVHAGRTSQPASQPAFAKLMFACRLRSGFADFRPR